MGIFWKFLFESLHRWISPITIVVFSLRGDKFLYCRDKKKEFAHNCAAYYPFGVDVFLSQRKIDHIARFVELPAISSHAKLPPMLVVNVQVSLLELFLFFLLIFCRRECWGSA